MKWGEELELAVEAARKAGEILQGLRSRKRAVLSSEGRDIKLQADRDSEKAILDLLARSPYPVLAEESGEQRGVSAEKPFWVVDPLDGTLNYSRNIPLCCVSVALVRSSEPLVGAVFDFDRDELFSAVAHEGAWLNGEPVSVSEVTDSRKGILATGFPVNRDFGDSALQDFLSHVRGFKKIRLFGSAALSLAYVACGRVDAYAEEDIMFWDVAAGLALVKGAGGFVRLEDSDRIRWGKKVFCASDSRIWNSEEIP